MPGVLYCALGLWLAAASAADVNAQSFGPRLVPVSRPNLCVTEGNLDVLSGQELSVDVPKMRAYVNSQTPALAEVRFTYMGATAKDSPLASGEMRRQFGLKLHAQDPCNLVYAMWRFEPESKIVVSIKSNPGQHTSAECSNHGYQNIKPRVSSPAPPVGSGESHTLAAEMQGTELRVFADNHPVWEGSLSDEVLGFNGPVGMRSDNVRLRIVFSTTPPAHPSSPSGCRGPEPE
jgi:hypothetical protein